MGIISKLMPARSANEEPVKIISDLDSLISRRIGVKFQGKVLEIEPVDTQSFIRIAQASFEFHKLLHDKEMNNVEVTQDQIYRAYYKFISILCPSISMDEIKSMKVQQLSALMQTIVAHISGKTAKDMQALAEDLSQEAQKKKMK